MQLFHTFAVYTSTYLCIIYVVNIVVPFRPRDLHKNIPLRHGVENDLIRTSLVCVKLENMTDCPGQLLLPIPLKLFHAIDARLHENAGKVFLRRIKNLGCLGFCE